MTPAAYIIRCVIYTIPLDRCYLQRLTGLDMDGVEHLIHETIYAHCTAWGHVPSGGFTQQGDMQRRGEVQTHCPNGHEYTDETTGFFRRPSGYLDRFCRVCKREKANAKRREAP